MAVSLVFRFLAGRYHATPFGHHVNEGLVEWPPSPWRVLRALISVGYTSGAWNGAGPPAAARSLVERLSENLPNYYLPPATGAHSRHYMPTCVLDDKKIEKTTLVFDTWAQTGDRELVISWSDVHLEEEELAILDVLVKNLNYLGRSESWVEGRRVEGEALPESNCFPEVTVENPGRGWEQVTLLAPTAASTFSAWRAEQVDKALADLPLPEGRRPSRTLLRKREAAVEPYPDDLLDCLQKDTTWWGTHGWSQPPGSRRVSYWRRADAMGIGRTTDARRAIVGGQRVRGVLLSLTNASRNDHALPPVTRTLPQAELLHRALVGVATRRGDVSPELTGRDQHHRPLRGPHEHAHVNPLDLDDDGHLDHVLIWAPGGLGSSSQAVIRAVRRTFTKGGIEPLRLALSAVGDLDDMVRLPGGYGQRLARITGSSATWRSVAPFVPPRHLKRSGKNSLDGQIRAELRSRGLSEPVAIHQLEPVPRGDAAETADRRVHVNRTAAARWVRFRHFILSRRHGPVPPHVCGFALQLEFKHPVSGPIALGYGSHFGLGLFESLIPD